MLVLLPKTMRAQIGLELLPLLLRHAQAVFLQFVGYPSTSHYDTPPRPFQLADIAVVVARLQ